jgi:PAS domain S-box-containing protein
METASLDGNTLKYDFHDRAYRGVPAIVCWVKADGTVLTMNPAGESITGYQAAEIIGKNFWETLHPGKAFRRVEEMLRLHQEQAVTDFEATLTRKDGGHRVVAWSLIDYCPPGEAPSLICFGSDITRLKQTEQEHERLLRDLGSRNRQLQTAADVSRSVSTILDTEVLMSETVERIKAQFGYYYVGLFLLDETGQWAVLRAGTGEAGRKMLAAGYRLAVGDSSMIGWTIAHSQPRVALDVGKDAVHFNNPYLPETRSEVTLPLISRDHCLGSFTFQSRQEAAFSGEDVAVLGVMAEQLAVAIDNSRLYEQVQRHAAELEVRVAERTAELTLVNQELEAFAYSVSHDLRAPLRSIDGFSQALLEDYQEALDEVGQDYLRRVRAASQRMSQLISDLLKLSRLTRGEMFCEQVDLSHLAIEVAAELQATAPKRRVDWDIMPGLSVAGDPRLLRVALENLMGNAWKFTDHQPHPRIEFGMLEEAGKCVYYIRDNGAGFDMEYAHKLFRAFQRLHSTAEYEGSGIGLATVQRIIHRHGGRIWAQGQVNRGATIYFTLHG